MKKTITCTIFLLIIFSALKVNAQLAVTSNWTTAFEPQKSFIENKGQFDGRDKRSNSKILFAIDQGGWQIYFTNHGLTYRFDKYERKSEDKEDERNSKKSHEELEREEHAVANETDIVRMRWMDANAGAEIIATEMTSDYNTYSNGNKNIGNVRGFKKITYKNLYPNIDVEYIFHPQQGIEYSLLLHPGADVSKVKMKYSDVRNISLDETGNVHLPTKFGDIIDHAPSTFYAANKNEIIASHFKMNGKTVFFSLTNYDNTKSAVIDPWTVVPAMPNSQKVWDIESDFLGNAFIYGGDWPYVKLQKYSSAGALIWTHTTAGWDSSSWIGTLITDSTGISYITLGSVAEIQKVDANGNTIWTQNGGFLDEYWSMAFNCDQSQLIVGGTRLTGLIPNGSGRIFDINMNNGNQNANLYTSAAIPGFIFNDPNEVRSVCFSPNGNYYFLTLDTIGSCTGGLVMNWESLSGYRFAYGSPSYGFTPQGQHSIRATLNYIYTIDGETIVRRNIADGSVINSAAIPGGSLTPGNIFVVGDAPDNNGIDIDSCGNVYVGSQNQVIKFDAALNFIASAPCPDAVYDVAVAPNGEVLACGHAFATSISFSACAQRKGVCVTSALSLTATSANVLCNGACNGTATANPQSGTPPYTYLWSPGGQTTQVVTGLCAGTYTVTVTDASLGTATTSVTVTEPPALAITTTSTLDTCGGLGGTATANPSGGTPGYTYLWSPSGQPTQTATGLGAGSYTVTVTDTNGCTDTSTVIVSSTNIVASVSPDTTVCPGNFVTLTSSGGTTYSWSNGDTIPVISVSPEVTTTYTVVVTSGTCTDTAYVTVTLYNNPVAPTFSQNGDTLFATQGFVSYQWYDTSAVIPGATNYYYVATHSGNYNLVVTDSNGCQVGGGILNVEAGINQFTIHNSQFTIYPNPAKDNFVLTMVNGQRLLVNLEIINSIGQIVYSEKLSGKSEYEISPQLAAGVYVVQLTGEKKKMIAKLVIE